MPVAPVAVTVRIAAIALALATVAWPAIPGYADDLTAAQVLDQLDVDNQVGEYIFVVDTSGSMAAGGVYAGVREALTRFFASLNPEDRIALVGFDKGQEVWQGPVGRSPDALLEHLAQDAAGPQTDIGSALEQAVGILDEPDSPALATVVLLTDGEHNRVTGSAFPFRTGRSWDRLRERAAAVTARKESFSAFSVPLRGNTDAALLQSVFPGGELMPQTGVDELNARFDKPRQAMLAAKVRRALGSGATAPVTVGWPRLDLTPGTHRFTVGLRGPAGKLPLQVRDLAVTADDPALRVTVETTSVDLVAGGTAELKMRVDWSPRQRALPWKRVHPTGRLRLHGTVDSPARAVLADDFGVSLSWRLADTEATPAGTAQVGSPLLWGVPAVLLLFGLVVLAFWLTRNPRLTGTLQIVLPYPYRPLANKKLRGRRVRFNPETLPGVVGCGQVRARWVRGHDSAATELIVTYWPTNARHRKVTRPVRRGQPLIINGVRFHWAAPPR